MIIYITTKLNIYIYGLYICIYSDKHSFTPTELHISIQNHYVQATGAGRSFSKHALQARRVLQKLLQVTIENHLDSASTVLTKQHY